MPSVQAASEVRTSAFEYDSSGLLVKEIIEPGDSNLCLVTVYSYDGYGNKTGTTTRNCNGSGGSHPGINSEAGAPSGVAVIQSRTSSNTYTSDGRFVLTSTNALNQSESKAFDTRFGGRTSLTGPNGLVTTWQYDSFGRKTLESRADGTRTAYQYGYCAPLPGGVGGCAGGTTHYVMIWPQDSAGNQNGPWTQLYYDAFNRQIETRTQGYDGGGATTYIAQRTEYDALGRVARQSAPYDLYNYGSAVWTTYSYDALGRVTLATAPDGSQTSTSYNGLTTSVTRAGQTTTQIKNSVGQLAQVIDAAGQSLWYGYDPFGNLSATTDAMGNTTGLAYDRRGRKTAMTDPDMGSWSYQYDALGQLVQQSDAKGQSTTMQYDKLGRLTQRSEPDLISTWTYDSCTKGIGKLCNASANNGYSRSHSYDNQGRSLSTSTTIDIAYTSSVTYDSQSRIATQTWPTGFAVKYVYSALGYLKEVRENSSNALYWQANAYDVAGHLLTQTTGNGLVTNQTFSATTGRLTAITAGAGNSVQNLSYTYDSIGNLTSRNDGNSSNGVANENYTYDNLNRLTSSTVNASVPGTVATYYGYNAIGNLICKSDLSACSSGAPNMAYGAVVAGRTLPHALASVTGTVHGTSNPSYSYDANGNLLSGAGRTVSYTSFNMTASITAPGKNGVAYQYDSEHMRVRETNLSPTNAVLGYTYYLHPDAANGLSYEVDKTSSGAVTLHKHYITAGGQAVALVTYTGTTWTTKYLHRDHLGSVTAITNASGTVIERLGYDSWGKRRNPNGVTDPNDTLTGANTDRGYTNAEHIESLSLINMNGRVYDPTLGRFMAADPIIQFPSDQQSYNRYSYVGNNPLLFTDPTGYKKFWQQKWFRQVAAIAVAAFAPQISTSIWGATIGGNSIVAGATGGFLAGGIAGGNLKSAFIGGITGAAFGWAGTVGRPTDLSRYAAHAGAGCLSGELGGGGCGRGAASALVGKYVTNATEGWNDLARGVAATVAGGTASVIGGGKFENGATTAAFGYLFNYCLELSTRCGFELASNFVKVGAGAASMFAGGALCAPPITLAGCGPGALMIGFGANELGEGLNYFASGQESAGNRGYNFLRESARSVAESRGLNPQIGESAYYGAALVTNIGAAVATVSKVAPYSGGWLTTNQPRLDTLGNMRANMLGASAVSNGFHTLNPKE